VKGEGPEFKIQNSESVLHPCQVFCAVLGIQAQLGYPKCVGQGFGNCYAVGVRDMREAADYYERVLGYRRGAERENFIEMSGPCVRIYVCEHDTIKPEFRMLVDSVEKAEAYLCSEGFARVEAEGKFLVQDPFGYQYCLIEG